MLCRAAGPTLRVGGAETGDLPSEGPCVVLHLLRDPVAEGADRDAHVALPCVHRPPSQTVGATT